MGRRVSSALTTRRVAALARDGRYGDGSGLYLQVRSGSKKSWIFRYSFAGRVREMGLGSVCDVSLASARDAAAECRAQLRRGEDPLAARDHARQRARKAAECCTLRRAVDAYLQAHGAAWTPRHRGEWVDTLEADVFPRIGDMSVAQITTEHVLSVLQPIWMLKHQTAQRVRQRIEVVLDFARVHGWRDGENPARWRGHLAHLLGKPAKGERPHHRALPWRDVPAFMAQLSQQRGTVALALQFTALTATRTAEALGARWCEIDQQAATWTIPASRMKARREHAVPLSDAAVTLLRQLEPARTPDGHVFQGNRRGRAILGAREPLADRSMAMLMARLKASASVHGLRSSFRDWVADHGHPRELAEAALAHAVGSSVEQAYARSSLLERRRVLMQRWGEFCAGQRSVGEVVELRQAVR